MLVEKKLIRLVLQKSRGNEMSRLVQDKTPTRRKRRMFTTKGKASKSENVGLNRKGRREEEGNRDRERERGMKGRNNDKQTDRQTISADVTPHPLSSTTKQHTHVHTNLQSLTQPVYKFKKRLNAAKNNQLVSQVRLAFQQGFLSLSLSSHLTERGCVCVCVSLLCLCLETNSQAQWDALFACLKIKQCRHKWRLHERQLPVHCCFINL